MKANRPRNFLRIWGSHPARAAGCALLALLPGLLNAQAQNAADSPEAVRVQEFPDEQEIPRAIPVNPQDQNIPRAEPVDPDQAIPRAIPVDPSELRPGPGSPSEPVQSPQDLDPQAPAQQGQAQTAPAGPEDRQLAAADGFYARQMWELALTQYARFLKEYPNAQKRQQALYRAGESALQLDKGRQARLFYNALLRDYTEGDFVGPAAYRMGEFYYNEGNYGASVTMFRRAVKNLEDKKLILSARYYEGRALEQMGRLGEARMAMGEVLKEEEKTPFSDVAKLAMARLEMELDNREKALGLYEELISDKVREDVRKEATVQAGLLAAELNQLDKAEQYLRRVLDGQPDLEWQTRAVKVLMNLNYEAERYQEVLDIFDTYRQSIPRNELPRLMLLTAKANRKAGNLDLASRILLEIFQDYPRSQLAEDAEYQYLLTLYQMDHENLSDRIDRFLEKNPSPEMRDRALLLKAEYHYNKGNWQQAADSYARVAQSNTLSAKIRAEAMNRQGWSYLEAGNVDEALSSFSRFINNHPDHPLVPRAIAQRALALTQTQKYDQAVEEFDRLLRNFPDAKEERELALQKKALILGQQDKDEAMMTTFEQLLEEFPETGNAAQANWWIGQTAYDLGLYDKSLEAMRRVREIAPKEYGERATVYVLLSLYNLEQLEELSREVDKFVEEKEQLRPPDQVLKWLGQQYVKKGQPGQAAHYLDMAMDSPGYDPHSDLALQAGLAQLQSAQYHEAVESFKRYLESHPLPAEQARGNLLLAQAYMKMQELDLAENAVQQALQNQPEGRMNGEARLALGDIELRRGNFEEAAKTFSSVALLYDDPSITPLALYKAGKAFEKSGDDRKAANMREDLEEKYPDFSYDPDKQNQFLLNLQG